VLQKLPPPCSSRGFAPCLPGDGSLPAHVVLDPRGQIPHDTTSNWGPRIGLAYRLDEKTAIRSSFGIFYDNFAGVEQTAQNIQASWPDVGAQLANNLNAPGAGTAAAYRTRPESVRRCHRPVSSSHAVQYSAVL